ncbi:MAG: sigma-70 family RNA polymerase sigma factor [Coriobacteriia bacterium]|nr:sigma-70 family RNA polymerase sigma factor [Coriobacteriia bacterium]
MTAIDEKRVDKFVRRAARGDTEAFGLIYEVYADRIHSYVRARLKDEHDAQDVTGTVFVKAFEAIGAYDRRGLPFGAWLFRIARNATIDHVRRAVRVPEPCEDLEAKLPPSDVMIDEQVAARVDAEEIRACVHRLTEDQAAVITCRFFFDLDVRQTARALDKTEGAIKALQHRAMRNLATMLAEVIDDE